LILVDVGNSNAHIKEGDRYYKLPFLEFIEKYRDREIFFISVNREFNLIAKNQLNWIDLSKFINIDGSYPTMGVDRKAFLLSRGDGIYIDAGSAITVDVKLKNSFIGGVILSGIWQLKRSYEEISDALKIDELERVDLTSLPKSNTKETVSYGIIAPTIALIEKIRARYLLPIYLTGGDGKLLQSYLKDSTYREDFIFDGLMEALKRYRDLKKES
jgi:type III pantothenate kinase